MNICVVSLPQGVHQTRPQSPYFCLPHIRIGHLAPENDCPWNVHTWLAPIDVDLRRLRVEAVDLDAWLYLQDSAHSCCSRKCAEPKFALPFLSANLCHKLRRLGVDAGTSHLSPFASESGQQFSHDRGITNTAWGSLCLGARHGLASWDF